MHNKYAPSKLILDAINRFTLNEYNCALIILCVHEM